MTFDPYCIRGEGGGGTLSHATQKLMKNASVLNIIILL